jgi:hypothetical protein
LKHGGTEEAEESEEDRVIAVIARNRRNRKGEASLPAAFALLGLPVLLFLSHLQDEI